MTHPSDRQDRLAQALRENLRRRKAQGRKTAEQAAAVEKAAETASAGADRPNPAPKAP